MNPLLELQERLTHSAVAGTSLLEEDFRLRKLADSLIPASQKNPVIGKIHAGLQELFQADDEQRGRLLLNLLGLVSAVLYTQAGYGLEGELIPLKGEGEGKILQIRYSHLQPLLKALTSTGAGRMEILSETIEQHPEYFCDDRVLHALIWDLHDPYGEMAQLVFDILKALGKGTALRSYVLDRKHRYILPSISKGRWISLLKDGFDPEGKGDMAKRVALVSAVSGEKENEWYRFLCEKGEKEIRQAAILALGHSPENIPLLLEMVRKERGKTKELVYYALSQQDSTELAVFWREELERHPAAAGYMKGSSSDLCGDLVSERLQVLLEVCSHERELPKERQESLKPLLDALYGKSSDGVLSFYRWLLEHKKLYRMTVEEQWNRPAALIDFVQEVICQTLVGRRPKALIDFLQSLPKKQQDIWKKAVFFADLLTEASDTVYDRWSRIKGIHSWLKSIEWTGENYQLSYRQEDFVTDMGISVQALKEPLAVGWTDRIIQNHWDDLARQLTDGMPKEQQLKMGGYFYQRALNFRPEQYADAWKLRGYLELIHHFGWENYEGILQNFIQACSGWKMNIHAYIFEAVKEAYREYAGEEQTRAELERALKFCKKSQTEGKTEAIVTMIEHFLMG